MAELQELWIGDQKTWEWVLPLAWIPLANSNRMMPAVLGKLTGLLPPVASWEALTSDFGPAAASCFPQRNAKCFKTLSFLRGTGAWGQSQCLMYIRQVFYLWTPPPPLPGEGHPKMEWNWRDDFFFVAWDFCHSFSQSQSWGQLCEVLHLDFKYFKKTLTVGRRKDNSSEQCVHWNSFGMCWKFIPSPTPDLLKC